MEGFSVIIPVTMIMVMITLIVLFCVCMYRRKMMLNNQRQFFTPAYSTTTMVATYPNQPGYPNTTGSPLTVGYPNTTGYPSQLHVNQGMGYSGYNAPPPAYGDCVGNMNHGGSGIGFDNMGSSFSTGGGTDFGSSSNTGGGGFGGSSNTGGGDFGGSSNTGGGVGSSSCGGDAF